MGTCDSKGNHRHPQANLGYNIPVSIPIILKTQKSIVKITVANLSGTGFFMKVSDTEKYLITNNHVISQNDKNKDIKIETYNKVEIKLNLNNHNTKFFPHPRDITMIEIKNEDLINSDIEFLDYDTNYIKGYDFYKNGTVFTIQYPNGGSAASAAGKIVDIQGYEFYHNIATYEGSSGSPIILYTTQENQILVIGIHKEVNQGRNLNMGTFIGEIFRNENSLQNNLNSSYSYITAEIDIKNEDINKDIRIINSYEEYQRNWNDKEFKNELMNEEEIKKCIISINDTSIPFNYFYTFKNKGKYNIRYSFNYFLTKTNLMFDDCSSLTNIDLSQFKAQNVTNMRNMFNRCSSLEKINLSNINTNSLTDMSFMFSMCTSLKDIDLSTINTQNVTTMASMFFGCKSLTSINLSNFNTNNAIDMSWMFYGCSSLIDLDLSDFNTDNVINMSWMFSGCASLKTLNLLNFNIKKVTDMYRIFFGCSSLDKINIMAKDNGILDKFLEDNN